MYMFALTQVKIMKQRASFSEPQCRPKARLATRPLLSLDEAKALERTFRVLANGTRLRLLHALARHPGLPVTELANMIGMKTHGNVSRASRHGAIGRPP